MNSSLATSSRTAGDRRPLLGSQQHDADVATVDVGRNAPVERAVEPARIEIEVVEAALGDFGSGRELENLRDLPVEASVAICVSSMTVMAAGASTTFVFKTSAMTVTSS
jgi:hypothetical protein